MTTPDPPGEEVVDASANELGVSVVTQRGAVIGLEYLLTEDEENGS